MVVWHKVHRESDREPWSLMTRGVAVEEVELAD